jgi:two-component system, NarL family, invasion response regulator UvrY
MADRSSESPHNGRNTGGAAPTRTVTVLVVDDQATFRRAARSLIAATPGFEQLGEAASGPDALELAAELRPDLVLLDVRMPGMDGIETARRLADAERAPTVVLISLEEVPDLPSAIDSVGVAEYLRKQDLSTHTLRKLWSRLRAQAGRAPGAGA